MIQVRQGPVPQHLLTPQTRARMPVLRAVRGFALFLLSEAGREREKGVQRFPLLTSGGTTALCCEESMMGNQSMTYRPGRGLKTKKI